MRDTVNYIGPDTFQKILDTIPELHIRKWKNEDIIMLFKMLYWLALRPIEGITLKKESIYIADRDIELGRTKTKARDVVPIPMIFVDELAGYIKNKPDGRLFPGLTYNTFIRWIFRLGIMLDIPAWKEKQKDTGEKTKGHLFRKTNLKDLYWGTHGKKLDPAIIAGQSRHSNPKVLVEHYLRLGHEAIKEQW